MPPALMILIIILVAVLVVAAAIYAHIHAKKRREALAALAARLGLSFDPSNDYSHDGRYGQFGVFDRGFGRRAYNTLEGEGEVAGRPVHLRMGDYSYKERHGSGKNRRTVTYRLSYLLVHAPFAAAPAMSIRSENFLDKIAGAFGFDDIDFESEEFSRRFCVKSSDKRFAYDVITPAMMEFLLGANGPALDLSGGVLLVVDGTRRWDVQRFEDTITYARRFFELWPEHLTRSLDERTRMGA